MYPTSLAFFKFNFLFSCVKPLFYRCWYFTFICQFCHPSFLFLGKSLSYIYLIFQRFLSPPTIIATPSHQVAERPQDSIAYWLEEQSESSFKICFREKEIFAGLHQNIKMVSGLRICPIIAINLQLSIETGQDCNGTGGFILAHAIIKRSQ